MLTPMEIQNKEFKKVFRGYSEEDVNDFMSQIAADYEIIFRDNREMKEVIEQLRDKLSHYEKMEATMTNTLMLAQETAENLKTAARKEADLIRQSAEQEKQQLIQNTAQAMRDGQERYEHVRHDVAVFRAKMESLLKSHLQLLEGMELPECRECLTGETVSEVKERIELEDSLKDDSLVAPVNEEVHDGAKEEHEQEEEVVLSEIKEPASEDKFKEFFDESK